MSSSKQLTTSCINGRLDQLSYYKYWCSKFGTWLSIQNIQEVQILLHVSGLVYYFRPNLFTFTCFMLLESWCSMGLLDLFVVALMPVLKVLLVTAVGLLLAIDQVNLLGPQARHSLNNIIFYVLTPALVVSNLAETITFANLVSLWFMPVNILLTFIIGSLLAWVLIKVTRTPPHLQGLVIGSCSAGNLGNLLLIIIPAVCEESNSPFGDSSVCSSYGEAYASLSMAVGAIYIWSYVFILMRTYANMSPETDSDDSEDIRKSLKQSSESCIEPLLSPTCQNVEDCEVQKPPSNLDGKSTMVSAVEKCSHCIKMFAEKINLKMILAPSTIAAIIGFLIGTISPIRKVLIGDSAPLRVIDSSAYLLGEAAIPCITLIVGANLLAGLRSSGVGVPLIIGIVAVRNVILPIVGIGIVKAAARFGFVGSDLLYQFVLLIQYALPPAMSVGTISQLFESGQGECSVIMLWTYLVAALSLTLWSTFYMWILA